MNELLKELREEGETKENKLYRCPRCHKFPEKSYVVVGHGQNDVSLECCDLVISGGDIVKKWNSRVSKDIGFLGNIVRYPKHKFMDCKDWFKEFNVFYGFRKNFTEDEARIVDDYYIDLSKKDRKARDEYFDYVNTPQKLGNPYGEKEVDVKERFELAKKRSKEKREKEDAQVSEM